MGDKNGKQDKNGKATSKKSIAFDIDNPTLPPDIADKALTSGGYPYDEELKKKVFKEDLLGLQLELLKLQTHIEGNGERVRRHLRGARRLRQGELHPFLPRAPQPAARPLRGAVETDRGRARGVVFPALRRATCRRPGT